MKKQRKIPGILGGMGPSATRDLYNEIINCTPSKTDQDHLEVLIHSYPHLDRTASILENAPSPLPTLVASAMKLKESGADFLAVPCNTAHFFIPQIEKEANVEFINMISETGKELKKQGIKKAGLLSTSATVKTGFYQRNMEMDVIVPDNNGIKKEMEVIYGKEGIKAGSKFEFSKKNKNLLLEVIEQLKKTGAESIILGCTELPLAIKQNDTDMLLINPTQVLAKAIVSKAMEN